MAGCPKNKRQPFLKRGRRQSAWCPAFQFYTAPSSIMSARHGLEFFRSRRGTGQPLNSRGPMKEQRRSFPSYCKMSSSSTYESSPFMTPYPYCQTRFAKLTDLESHLLVRTCMLSALLFRTYLLMSRFRYGRKPVASSLSCKYTHCPSSRPLN